MDFSLTSDQLFIKETLHKFMLRECPREKAHALDEQNTFPGDLLAKIAEIGFCGLNTPEDFGGFGQDLAGTVIAMEEIAMLSPALAALFASVCLCGGRVISQFGSPAQRMEFLALIAQGKLKFSFALGDSLNEEQAGVKVVANEGVHTLTGRIAHVQFCNPGGANYLIVRAQSGEESGDVTLFLVPMDAPGLHVQPIPTVGMRGIGLGEVSFDQVHLNPENILGGPQQFGQGRVALETLVALDLISGAALGLGIAQGAYAYALNYARERAQFGQKLLQFEAIEHMLVDQAVSLQSTRWQLYQACWLADQGKAFGLEAAMVRLQAGTLARQAGLQSVHILGGYGYMAEYDAQRSMRDALVLFPGGESSELLKSKIGKHLNSL